MRTFEGDKTRLAIELEQMVVDYWREVDSNAGQDATRFFCKDVEANFGSISFKGHAGVKKYYDDRLALIKKEQEGGIRTTRHVFFNLQIVIESDQQAVLTFLIATFGGAGRPPILGSIMPVAVSDTRFECRREEDGAWRIYGFFGSPVFVGTEPFARKALTGI